MSPISHHWPGPSLQPSPRPNAKRSPTTTTEPAPATITKPTSATALAPTRPPTQSSPPPDQDIAIATCVVSSTPPTKAVSMYRVKVRDWRYQGAGGTHAKRFHLSLFCLLWSTWFVILPLVSRVTAPQKCINLKSVTDVRDTSVVIRY